LHPHTVILLGIQSSPSLVQSLFFHSEWVIKVPKEVMVLRCGYFPAVIQ
jgi:hypothetical protein